MNSRSNIKVRWTSCLYFVFYYFPAFQANAGTSKPETRFTINSLVYYLTVLTIVAIRHCRRVVLKIHRGKLNELDDLRVIAPRINVTLHPNVMKASTILSWKHLVSKIHPPIPMDQRESQKLLFELKSSFQKHLDRVHPRAMSDQRHTVDHHILSILANPLLSVKPKAQIVANQCLGINSINLDHVLKRPMEYFKHEIAAGTATVQSARTCIIAHAQKAFSGQQSRSPGAAVILRWLWSSPGAEKEFLLHGYHLKLLMRFLNAEGLENLVWHWIKRLQNTIDGETSAEELLHTRKSQAAILYYYLMADCYRGSISALDVFLRGVRGIPTWSGLSNSDIAAILEPGGSFLVRKVRNWSLDPESLHSLSRTAEVWSSLPRLYEAILGLYTDTDAALCFLQEVDHVYVAKLNKRRRHDVIHLSLKLAELLLSEGSDQAAEVMGFLKTHFAVEIDYSPPASSELEKQSLQSFEDSNLRLLDTLALH